MRLVRRPGEHLVLWTAGDATTHHATARLFILVASRSGPLRTAAASDLLGIASAHARRRFVRVAPLMVFEQGCPVRCMVRAWARPARRFLDPAPVVLLRPPPRPPVALRGVPA